MLAMKLAHQLALGMILVLALGWQAQAEDAIRWRKDLEEAKQEAAQSGRLVLLHFYGSSCAPCAKLDKEVFCQKQAADAIEACYVPIKINVDHSMPIASAYNVTSWPTDVVITPTGQVVAKFVSPQGIQAYLTRMDQVAVATRDQAAAGLVKMGPNGTNPYSNIAIPAAGNAAAATNLAAAPNNNYAAPTQYQEAVPGPGAGGNYAPPAGSPYVPQGGQPYDPGPSRDPYNAGNPYGTANNTAAPAAQTGDRYGNSVVGDRYATPQYGNYNPAAPSNDQYTPQEEGNPFSNQQNIVGPAGGYGNENAGGSAPSAQTQPVAGAYAPPAGPQIQQNPYVAPPQDRYANGAAGAAAPTGYDPNQRYSSAPPYTPAGTSNVGQQIVAPPNGNDPRYAAAPQQTNTAAGYNPAIDYSQAPPMTPPQVSSPGPALGAPSGGAPVSNPPANGGPAAQQISGNPAFGLDGFCPVALAEHQRWVQGDKAWGAIHLGRTYLFTSQESQQKFLATPDAFAPVLSGNDPVLAIERNQHVPGSRSHGVFYRDHVYLFSGEESLAQFGKDPERYANGVRQAMQQRQAPGEQRR